MKHIIIIIVASITPLLVASVTPEKTVRDYKCITFFDLGGCENEYRIERGEPLSIWTRTSNQEPNEFLVISYLADVAFYAAVLAVIMRIRIMLVRGGQPN
jgi:hypothetical protein